MLIVTLLLPLGTCQPPARAVNHECCGHYPSPVAGLKANCCLVHGEVPAIVVEQAAVSPVLPVSSMHMSSPAAIAIHLGMPVALPDHSPPGGITILRI